MWRQDLRERKEAASNLRFANRCSSGEEDLALKVTAAMYRALPPSLKLRPSYGHK